MNVNIQGGIDGCNLPYDDESFDAVVSVATLEHVGDLDRQLSFLKGCHRIAKQIDVHWFPCGPYAIDVEKLKKKYGHYHPYTNIISLDDLQTKTDIAYDSYPFMSCGLHLLLCMTLTPSLKAPEIYDFILKNEHEEYGLIVIGEK